LTTSRTGEAIALDNGYLNHEEFGRVSSERAAAGNASFISMQSRRGEFNRSNQVWVDDGTGSGYWTTVTTFDQAGFDAASRADLDSRLAAVAPAQVRTTDASLLNTEQLNNVVASVLSISGEDRSEQLSEAFREGSLAASRMMYGNTATQLAIGRQSEEYAINALAQAGFMPSTALDSTFTPDDWRAEMDFALSSGNESYQAALLAIAPAVEEAANALNEIAGEMLNILKGWEQYNDSVENSIRDMTLNSSATTIWDRIGFGSAETASMISQRNSIIDPFLTSGTTMSETQNRRALEQSQQILQGLQSQLQLVQQAYDRSDPRYIQEYNRILEQMNEERKKTEDLAQLSIDLEEAIERNTQRSAYSLDQIEQYLREGTITISTNTA
jgi:hypothetical protein